jgi:hypothetical protein
MAVVGLLECSMRTPLRHPDAVMGDVHPIAYCSVGAEYSFREYGVYA